MSSTEGPNTASTASMSSTEPRVQAVPTGSNPEILGVQVVSAAQNLEILRVLAVYNPEILRVLAVYTPEILPVLLSTPMLPTKVICFNEHSWDRL